MYPCRPETLVRGTGILVLIFDRPSGPPGLRRDHAVVLSLRIQPTGLIVCQHLEIVRNDRVVLVVGPFITHDDSDTLQIRCCYSRTAVQASHLALRTHRVRTANPSTLVQFWLGTPIFLQLNQCGSPSKT